MKEVKEFVDRWFEERVEVDSEVVTNSYDALSDFFDWLTGQTKWEVVGPAQWGSAMKHKGFKQEKSGDDWVIQGIRLKGE
jgi:hypothetical protein